MDKKIKIAIVAVVILFTLGWTYTYNTTTPADGDDPKEGAERIREVKQALQERLNKSHVFPLDDGQVSDANAGEHRWVDFTNEGDTDPCLYTADENDKKELYWIDEDGNSIWLTETGYLRGEVLGANSVGADAIRAANNTWIHALNAAGDGDVKLIKADANDDTVLPAGAELETNAAPTADAGIANKKYVDDTAVDITGSISRSVSTDYEATTSGFLVVRCTVTASAGNDRYVTVCSDDNATPTTVVGKFGVNDLSGFVNTGVFYGTITVPIISGKFYRVNVTAGATVGIKWYANS